MLTILFVFPSRSLFSSMYVVMFVISLLGSLPNQQWYEMVLYLSESRTHNPLASKITKIKPKNLVKLYFLNKSKDMKNISKTINKKKRIKTSLHNSTEQN